MSPWKLPILVGAIAVPIVAGFFLGGPGIGVAIGALAAVAIVYVAVRQRPRGGIGADAPPGRRLLVVVGTPVEDPTTIERIVARAAGGDGLRRAERVVILAPARIGFLDRWASDLEGARRAAQENLVISVASLAKAGLEAEARVGDEDLVQAVEDQIGSYPATEVLLVTAGDGEDAGAAGAAAELRARLRVGFEWLTA